MNWLWQDLSYALRSLRRSPGFTAVAIVLLALGIGANTAVFSVVYAVLLRPLPYPQPDRIVQLVRAADVDAVSVPEYQFVRDNASSFAAVAGYQRAGERAVSVGGTLEWAGVLRVTDGFLRTLGITPALGREFQVQESRADGPAVAILSDALWRRAFGGAPDVVGRGITLDKTSYTVVGVLPAGFWFPLDADVLVPLQPSGSIRDFGSNTAMIARLDAGVTLNQAAGQLRSFTEGLRQSNTKGLPDGYQGLTPVRYQDQLTGGALRTNLLLLFGATGLLLLIACANLAGLMAARVADRQREVAVRLALGASVGRLVPQFLAENVLLSAAGGLAGVVLASWSLQALLALAPFGARSPGLPGLNAPVLAFTAAVMVATNVVFSLAPFLSASRLNVSEALKSSAPPSGGAPRQRGRRILVTGQVAVSAVLLVGAALLIQTLDRLYREPLGFAADGLITFSTPVSLERQGQPEEIRQFNAALLERIRALPGVRSAAAVNMLPLTGPANLPTQQEGRPEHSIGGMEVRAVTPQYFETMGIPIVRGRPFREEDSSGAPPALLVSERVARQWWSGENPLGDGVVIGMFRGQTYIPETPRRTVIGVAADTKSIFLREPPRPTVYVPATQWTPGGMNWIVRADAPATLAPGLREAVRELDPRQRVERMQLMNEIVGSTTADARRDAWLFGSLAALALALTAVGVYGLLAFSVARRSREIGTRMALGATPGRVLGLILRQGGALIVTGLALGLAAAWTTAPLLASLLFGVTATDWRSYALVAAALLCAGLLASYLPARRATRVDPVVALRNE